MLVLRGRQTDLYDAYYAVYEDRVDKGYEAGLPAYSATETLLRNRCVPQ